VINVDLIGGKNEKPQAAQAPAQRAPVAQQAPAGFDDFDDQEIPF